MSLVDLYKDCTIECERMPQCATCKLTKQPIGRSAPLDSCYCSWECPDYRNEPTPGHLWPGELRQIREDLARAIHEHQEGERGDGG